MAPSVVSVKDMLPVPEDGFDDSEFTEYLDGNGHSDRAQRNSFMKCISSVVAEALSMCQSAVEKSSRVIDVLTHDSKEDALAIDYIETAYSFLQRIYTDSNEIRNIVTGGAEDAWYQASSQGLSSSTSCLGMVYCFAPAMPVSLPMTACGAAAQQMITPSLPYNSAATQVNNSIEAVQQIDACSPSPVPVLESAPSRSAAPLVIEDTAVETALNTTLILRNLPAGLGRSALLGVLRSEGFADHVVFIYLPMNLRSSGNFGYAFVDFSSTEVAEHCKEKLEGFNGWSEASEKALEVAWSETQGLDAHVQRYRDSPLMHASVEDELKPAMFKNGVRVAFPRPTKPIRAPRLRKTKNL